jgi:hypothetical protein
MTVSVLLGLGLLAACAQPPETIPPTAVSPLKYQGSNCRTLAAQVQALDGDLAALYTQQRTRQTNDVFKTLFLLHPRGTIVGPDLVPTISLLKGEREAANAVLQARCPA